MAKKLISDRRFCSGCMSCVVNCSQFHEGHAAPTSSRVQIDHDPFTGEYLASYCMQCQEKVCARTCPAGALVENTAGSLTINYELCTGCRACSEACPHRAIFYDPATQKVIKCDTCNGDPQCARVCYTGALLWMEPDEAESCEGQKLESRYFLERKPRR